MLPLVFAAVLGCNAPSFARDMALKKYTADEVKSVCAKVGGSFSQGEAIYGCGTDCHGKPGTECTVNCSADHKCIAQVVGGRRPHDLEQALQASGKH
jgi:hypothetical protein